MTKRNTTTPASVRQTSALRKSLLWRWEVDLLAQFGFGRSDTAEGWNIIHADLSQALAAKGAGKEEVSAALDYLLSKRRQKFVQEEVEGILGFKLTGKAAGKAAGKASSTAASPTRADLVAALLGGRISEEAFKLALSALALPAEEPVNQGSEPEEFGPDYEAPTGDDDDDADFAPATDAELPF